MKYKIFYKACMFLILLFLTFHVNAGPVKARAIYDFDGDGRTDFAVMRIVVGASYTWFIMRSRDGFFAQQWGYEFGGTGGAADASACGDYDGDGKWDITVVRQILGSPPVFWYVLNSSDGSMTAQHWGTHGDQSVPQDYDGDGKTDFAVYRNGWWYILRSSDGQFQAEKFGTSNDLQMQGGDYDGDGKDDLAIIRIEGGGWRQWIRYSATGWWKKYDLGNPAFTGIVTGDYDGDGKADVAIWQGNNWLWERSSDGQLGGGLRFGIPQSDIPVPADYDGDGKTDIAVFRDSGGAVGTNDYFYVQQSRDGFLAIPWGGGGNTDANLFDRRYIRPVGFRPAESSGQSFKDKGPFPRLVEIRKN